MSQVLVEIISLLVAGLTNYAEGIGAGLNSFVTNIFVDSTGETMKLTIFGGCIAIFGGLALAVSLSRWVLNFCASLGARNR